MPTDNQDKVEVMTPKRYFSLRSTLGPPPSRVPAVILGILTVLTVVGLFVDIAANSL